jgi:(2Fe-2S) ferredoxin
MSEITQRRQRIVLCRGQYCNIGRRADKLYQRLEAVLDDINGDQYPKPVKMETANCLSMCGAGPNLVLYPEGMAFNHLDEKALDEFINAYLKR